MDLKKKVDNGENIPLSFYFDLSGSMENYIRTLSIMALRIMKKDVKVIIGFNQNAYAQINKIPQNCSPEQFMEIMFNLPYLVCEKTKYDNDDKMDFKTNLKGLEIEGLDGIEIDRYLIEKKAEKVVVFSDFDPLNEICNLSQKCEVYWFCFQRIWLKEYLKDFKGKFFSTENEKDILEHLKHINSRVYERQQREKGDFGNRYKYNSQNINYNNFSGEYKNEGYEYEDDEDEYEL